MKKSSSFNASNFTYKEGAKEIEIDLGNEWSAILQGQIVLLVSEAEEPVKIEI